MNFEVFENRTDFENRFLTLRWSAGRGFTAWNPQVVILMQHVPLCGDDYKNQHVKQYDNMIQWCEMYCKGRFSPPNPTTWKFEFRDDAMRFKLTWA